MKTLRIRGAARGATMALAAVAALSLSACEPEQYLSVTDPDIINPSDAASPAGANAVRVGALARLNAATTGGEGYFLLGGLFTDEWINGDSFIARQEIDQREITPQNNFLTDANRTLHRGRLGAEQAIDLIREFNPTAPKWQIAEMYFVQAFLENLVTEHLCSGLSFSGIKNGQDVFGAPLTTQAAFERALAHVDSGLTELGTPGTGADDVRVSNALKLTKGRILVNLDRYAEASAAVAGVPNTYAYNMFHALTANSNQFWSFNNSAGRYSVGTSEGGNGLPFVTANDPRVPTCAGGSATCIAIGVTKATRDDLNAPYNVQRMWPVRETTIPILTGIEARLIEAEAQLDAGNTAGSLATLNAARTTVTGLAALADAGSTAARVDQLFRERAFWLFGRGTRTGDMRRLIRQYGRAANTVFPTGAWHKSGGVYGGNVNMPLPLAETNNPQPGAGVCIDRNA